LGQLAAALSNSAHSALVLSGQLFEAVMVAATRKNLDLRVKALKEAERLTTTVKEPAWWAGVPATVVALAVAHPHVSYVGGPCVCRQL
jgi:hypothetical protein